MGEGGGSHLISPGLTRSHLVSLGLTWSHLIPLDLTWSHLVSLGLTWSHLVSHGLTWSHLISQGCTVVEPLKTPAHSTRIHRGRAKRHRKGEPNGTVGRTHKDSPKSKTEVTRNSRGRSGTHPGRTTDSPRPHRLTFHSHWKHFDSTHRRTQPGHARTPEVKSPATRGNTSHGHTQLRLATHERNETKRFPG